MEDRGLLILKNIIKILIFTLIISTVGIGEAAYMNNTKIGLDNGAYITVMDTNFSSLKKYGAGETPEFTLEYTLNGSASLNGSSRVRYTTNTDKTITSPTYNVTLDNLSVNITGTAGFINFSVMMNNDTDLYNFTSNAVFVSNQNATDEKIVYFNYTGAYPTNLSVSWSKYWGYDIDGYVTNVLEFYLEGARIDFTGKSKVFTDANGYYIITNIKKGNYTMLVRQIDYRNYTQSINITNFSKNNVNVTLQEVPYPVIKASPGFDSIGLLMGIMLIFILRRK